MALVSVAAKGKLGPQPVSVLGKNKSFPVKLPPPPLTPRFPSEASWDGEAERGPSLQPSELSCLSKPSLPPAQPYPNITQVKAGEGPSIAVSPSTESWIEGEEIPVVALGTERAGSRVQVHGWGKPPSRPCIEHRAIYPPYTSPSSLHARSSDCVF